MIGYSIKFAKKEIAICCLEGDELGIKSRNAVYHFGIPDGSGLARSCKGLVLIRKYPNGVQLLRVEPNSIAVVVKRDGRLTYAALALDDENAHRCYQNIKHNFPAMVRGLKARARHVGNATQAIAAGMS